MVNDYDESEAMRTRSGDVQSNSRVTSFLYELIRDYLPAGTVEKIVRNSQTTPTKFSNGWLANYAEDLAKRLENDKPAA